MAQFKLSQLQSQAILDMQLQRLTGLERQKILDELPRADEDHRAAPRDPVERGAADAAGGQRAPRRPGEVRRRPAHRDHRRHRRAPDRGPDRRRRHGDHGHQHRLHQADADHHLPRAAARRQGTDRHAHARGGLRQPPLRRLDPRLHHDLHRPRPRLLAEGPRGARCRSGRQGQGDRQPGPARSRTRRSRRCSR